MSNLCAKKRRARDPEGTRAKDKKYRLMGHYGISVEQFNSLLSKQKGKCWICLLEMTAPCIDHCHTTGKTRGLLCSSCNKGLGFFKDNTTSLLRAIEYLRLMTLLKQATIKKYALEVSSSHRAGKFRRVGKSFVDRCEARIEATIRALYRGDLGPITAALPEEGLKFITPYGKNKIREQLELLARDVIFSEVRSHPSLGKTLK